MVMHMHIAMHMHTAMHMHAHGHAHACTRSCRRVLFISTVLTHDIKRHSLVFNPKRFNVAVTRAKALLVVVGSRHTPRTTHPLELGYS